MNWCTMANTANNKIYGHFWNPERLDKTGKPLLMAAQPRGIGKSTGIGIKCIIDYYNSGIKFIYCRRTDDELKRTRKNYFDGALRIYNDFYKTNHVWVYDSETYIDENKNVVGYTVPLNLADKYKSATFGADGVRTIIYDEFILRRGKEAGYLGGEQNPLLEYDLLIGLYQSVDRAPGYRFLNQTKIWAFGNFANLYNPIMLGCNASDYIEHDSKFVNPKTQPWACELSGDYANDIEITESYGYQLSRDSVSRADYNNDGFLHSENVFKLTGIRKPVFNVAYHGRSYGVWEYEKLGLIYVSGETSPARNTIALTAGDSGKINQVTALKYRYMPSMQMLRTAAERGFLAFDSERAKNDILTYLDFTL